MNGPPVPRAGLWRESKDFQNSPAAFNRQDFCTGETLMRKDGRDKYQGMEREAFLQWKRERNAVYRSKHRQQLRDAAKRWYVEGPAGRAKRKCFPLELFRQRLESQNNRCAICMKEFSDALKPVADHCHKTLKPRGVLCGRCNMLLGKAHDDPFQVKHRWWPDERSHQRAEEYLLRWSLV